MPHVLPAGALTGRPQPLLDAEGLRLRPWQLEDAPALGAAYADPGIQHRNGASTDEAEAQTLPALLADR